MYELGKGEKKGEEIEEKEREREGKQEDRLGCEEKLEKKTAVREKKSVSKALKAPYGLE